MVSNAWHKVWIQPTTVELLKGECLWNVYAAVSRPYQVAMDIVAAIAEIGSWASYEDIAKFVGFSPMTVSQCVNDLAKAGYPLVWNNAKQLRLERGTTTGRPPKAIGIETKTKEAKAVEDTLVKVDSEIYFEDTEAELQAEWVKAGKPMTERAARTILAEFDLTDNDAGEYCDEGEAIEWLQSMFKLWEGSNEDSE